MRKARIQNIKCLFGMHDYGIPNKNNPDILMCKHCMKAGYRCDSVGVSYWYDYNENGNKIKLWGFLFTLSNAVILAFYKNWLG